MITPSGGPMRRLTDWSSNLALCAALSALALLFLPDSSAAQSVTAATPDTRGVKDFASSGRITFQIQDAAGAPFFEGAAIRLVTSQVETSISTTSNQAGRAQFTDLPVGQYLVEIRAPGYRTVQEQVLISGSQKEQNITVALVPTSVGAKVKVGSVSTSPKAIKESEKALQALQLNRLDQAQQHLSLALAFDPNFADGNYLMGLLLLRQKDPSKAAAYLQKSLKLSPEHTGALLALGEAQYLAHDYSSAAASFEKFLHDQPNSPQAPVAQKYADTLRKMSLPRASGDAVAAAGISDLSSSDVRDLSGGAAAADSGLPPLPDLNPVTEANWAPPDVDSEKLDLDSSDACELNQVIDAVSSRTQELVQNVDRFTATEQIEHSNISPMGLQTSREARKFDYVVEIHQVGKNDLDVREYRNSNSAVATRDFPGH